MYSNSLQKNAFIVYTAEVPPSQEAFASSTSMNGANSPDPALSPEKQANQIRFETELEFVQCLANPHYLASLASQGLLAQPNFVAYLKYLTYWLDVDKGFARFIVYEALKWRVACQLTLSLGILMRCTI